jgi:hypothetical protein
MGMVKLKVCLSAMWFPLTMALWCWRAFERRKDIDLFVTGPFFDDWIPWGGGMKLPREYVKQPHYALPPSAAKTKLPASFIEPQLPWRPDLYLQVDAGWHLATKPDAEVVGLIETDPHALKGHYAYPKAYSDKVFCMQSCYMEANEIFLPYGYDPEIHFPEKREKIYDACLIGLHYSQRDRLVQKLRSRGLNVYYSIGEIYDQYREKYNQSKIALSWSAQQDTPARCWEALAMGVPLVANHTPDMSRFFRDGGDYLGFDTLEEAERQVMRLMTDDNLLASVAESGHEAVQGHDWDSRVSQILAEGGWESKDGE